MLFFFHLCYIMVITVLEFHCLTLALPLTAGSSEFETRGRAGCFLCVGSLQILPLRLHDVNVFYFFIS